MTTDTITDVAANAIRLEHRYRHPPALVWRALTDPTLHARWFAPGDIRPVIGHTFHLEMPGFGPQPCEILVAEPERLLKYRFAITSLDTTLSFQLEADGAGTHLTFLHEGFDLDSPMGQNAFKNMRGGWVGILARLEDVAGEA